MKYNNMTVDEILKAIEVIRREKNWTKDEKIKPLSEYEISKLPKIPSGWKWVTSNEISMFITNGVHSPTAKEDTLGLGMKMLRITDIDSNNRASFSNLPYCTRFTEKDYEKSIKKDDIYISFTGNILGKRYIVKETIEDIVFAHYFVRWHPIIVNAKYIYYVLLSRHFDRFMYEHKLGSSQPNLKVTDLKRVPLPVPDMYTQNKIAAILSQIDDKIELNNKINENLQSLSKLLFKHWFVDFDFLNEEGLPYKSSGGQMVDSELGMIPKEWKIDNVNNIAEVIGGGTPPTKNEEYYTDNGIAWITPKDLSGYTFKFISRGDRDITEVGLKNSSAKLIPKGTVLFSSRAPIGYIAIAKNEVCTNQGFKSLVPKDGFGTEFIYNMLISNKERIEGLANGSTFKEVSGQTIKDYKIVTPIKLILDRFEQLARDLSEKILNNEEEIISLTNLRDSLLPKLINGEIDLDNLKVDF